MSNYFDHLFQLLVLGHYVYHSVIAHLVMTRMSDARKQRVGHTRRELRAASGTALQEVRRQCRRLLVRRRRRRRL